MDTKKEAEKPSSLLQEKPLPFPACGLVLVFPLSVYRSAYTSSGTDNSSHMQGRGDRVSRFHSLQVNW